MKSQQKNTIPPNRGYLDGGWGWVVMMASFLSQTMIGSIYFGYGVLLPAWMYEFQASGAFTSLVGSTTAGAISGCGPLASLLILKWGCRKTHILGGFIMSFAFICCYFANSMVSVFVLYSVIGGIGGSLCYVPSIITISEYFKAKRSIAIGVVASGCGFGAFVFPVIFEYLMMEYGWRGVMLIAGAINCNMIAFGITMYPVDEAPQIDFNCFKCCSTKKKSKTQQKETVDNIIDHDINFNLIRDGKSGVDEITPQICEEGVQFRNSKRRRSSFQLMRAWLKNPMARRKSSLIERAKQKRQNTDVVISQTKSELTIKEEENIEETVLLETIEEVENTSYRKQFISLIKSPTFYILLFNNVTAFFGMLIVFGLTPLRSSNDFGMTAKQGAYLVSIMGFANLIGRFVWGFVAAIKSINTVALFITLRVIAGVLTLASPMITSFEGNVIYSGLIGLLFGFWSIYPVVVADQFGDEMLTIAYGYLEAANGVGSIIGPLVGGYLFDVFHNYKYSFFVSGCVLIVGVIPLFISCFARKILRIFKIVKS